MDTICLDKTVILQKDTVLKAVKLVAGKLIVFEKLKFKPENAKGCQFGTIFNVQNLQLYPVLAPEKPSLNQASGKDNRDLIDTFGKSQALKREDLLQLKEEGATGEEIIKSLVENSSSFSQKTTFSQNKYLKKKQKKYSSHIKILKPTARLICKLYGDREPAKICHMQIDSMSQIITNTNIQSESKVVVVETCSGVLLGMILERLGGRGSVVNLHVGETPANIFAMSHFNYPESYWDIMHSLPLHKLAPLLADKPFESTFSFNENIKVTVSDHYPTAEKTSVNLNVEACVVVGHGNDSCHEKNSKVHKRKRPLTSDEKLAIRTERQQKRFNHQKSAWELLKSKNMDALIVASKYHPTPIVLSLLEVLALSKPFAVYSEYKEPLMELFVHLSTTNAAINLQITDTFLRYYQVLQERTHPHVTMPGSNGFLLTGIKVG